MAKTNGRSKRCQALTVEGQPCRMSPLRGSDYCRSHDPDHRDAFLEGASRGGLARQGRKLDLHGAELTLNDVGLEDVKNVIIEAVRIAMAMEPSLSKAHELGYLSSRMMEILRYSEDLDQLDEIRALLELARAEVGVQ